MAREKNRPAGLGLVQPVEDVAPALTADEEEGIRQALRSLERGEGKSIEEVRQAVSAPAER